ncbi:DNA-binding transcriptional regulator, MarR family [Desulforamulus aeronauticus DSM 10349]|uniref:DNA-binding transcriptional regulator, MarR family n=2 Tax=Desulforamulus aeronauticus TaxID=53343 RepID=A0A1M6UME9_9FIRM|nr:DNA-binding transcriptional regulator, MarR family [Desulforamulus aeronauticus DSM 10349]
MQMKIEESLGFKLAKASQRMFGLFEDYLIRADITSKQNGAMLIIHEYPNLTQKEVANIQRVDQTTMGQIIDQLEKKQFVMRVKHPTDRRAYCLVLTDAGEDLITSLWADMKRCEATFLQKLNQDEIEQLFKLLDKIERE